MVANTKLARFDSRVRAFLEDHFKGQQWILAELASLWETYYRLGLPNEDFVAEFTNGKPASLAQRTWELLLAQQLHDQGHSLTCVRDGPDLRFEHGGNTIWVEAVCPEPRGLPSDWLDQPGPGQTLVREFPHERILLRWTTAFDAKVRKHGEYVNKGIVLPTDAYVIAINGCQLGIMRDARGITQMPFGVETVFPVGPLRYRIDSATSKLEGASISERYAIINHNNVPVGTTSFLEEANSGISALIGCATDRRYGQPLPVHVVHNPLATVQAPRGIWGAQNDEWCATPIPGAEGEFALGKC